MPDEWVTFLAGLAASAMVGGVALMGAVDIFGGHLGYLHAVTAWVLLRPVFVPLVRFGVAGHHDDDPGDCAACAADG